MIKAYTGKTGSGKTYLMVKEAYIRWKKGENIFSNTYLNFKAKRNKEKYGKIIYFENIRDIIDANNGVILFDEAQSLFNSRLWESLPEEFQYKLQQHRKHKLDLICTTQNMGTIDIAYRRLVQDWYHCKNILQIGKSPRIKIGLFKKEFKDIDQLYNKVDDLIVPTLRTKIFLIHYFSKTLYDTMYDIGFKMFRTVCLNSLERKLILIIPKKMPIKTAIQEIKMMKMIQKL